MTRPYALDIADYRKEWETLTAPSLKKHLFNWVFDNLKEGNFVNPNHVKELLIEWQINITEDEKSNRNTKPTN